jgi:hypothetical protein
MKALLEKMFCARPHPDPLPRGEGTAVVHFIFFECFSGCWPRPICQVTESVSPSPWGEGRGEGGYYD